MYIHTLDQENWTSVLQFNLRVFWVLISQHLELLTEGLQLFKHSRYKRFRVKLIRIYLIHMKLRQCCHVFLLEKHWITSQLNERSILIELYCLTCNCKLFVYEFLVYSFHLNFFALQVVILCNKLCQEFAIDFIQLIKFNINCLISFGFDLWLLLLK